METKAQITVRLLRDKILSGEFVAGTHLEEQILAVQFEVSRTPLRLAFSQLAQEGLLDYVAKRGYVVRTFGLAEIAEAYSVRSTLEGLACRLAAEQGLDEAVIARLTNYVQIGDDVLAKGRLDAADFPTYRDMNVMFHEAILSVAGNRLLANFVQQTYHLPLTSDRVMYWTDFQVIQRSHDDHRRIVDALMERSAWRAEALMREHIHASGRFVSAQYLTRRRPNANLDAANRGSVALRDVFKENLQ